MSHSTSDNWIRRFDVSDPERHPKGFTVYKITSVVFPKNCPEAATRVIVWKRYKNFLKLHNELKQCHEDLHLKIPFPPFPKAKFFGRFDEEVVEQRRQAALVFLQFVADVPVLFTSQPFVKFFETGYSVTSNSPVLVNEKESNKGPQSPNASTADSSDSATTPDSRSTSPAGGKLSLTKSNPVDLVIEKESTDPNAAVFTPIPPTLSQVSTGQERGNVKLVLSSPEQSETSCDVVIAQQGREGDSSFSDRVETSCESNDGKSEQEKICETKSENNGSKEVKTVDEQETNHIDKAEAGMYITEAAYHLGLAAEHEASDSMDAAFAAYKAGIACLLTGVKDDPDVARADLVRSKTACYLLRAEKIYQEHLLDSSKPPHSQGTGRCLLLPLCDLKYYKVFGVTSSVILTRNTQDRHTYVIKVLHKSPCPVDGRLRSILPANVPFMCHLYACFENESSVFLVLQHATGDLLWNHVAAYLNSPDNGPDSPPYIDQVVTVSKKHKSDATTERSVDRRPNRLDIYSKPSSTEPSHPLVSSQSQPFESEPASIQPSPNPNSSMNIPQVILPDNQPDRPNLSDDPQVSTPAGTTVSDHPPLRNDSYLQPEDFRNQSPEDSSLAVENVKDVDTTHLLENAHRLLESVNRSLNNIEGVSNQAGATMETQLQLQKERRRPRKLSTLSPTGRSQDRSRRSSAVRRSRWEKKFSCDDMFEGRARALSGSLDREAQWLRMAASTPVTPKLPTATVRSWAAQLLLALEALHRWGIVIGDLRPDNIMLTSSAVLMLTYQCYWVSVDRVPSQDAIDQLYAAPEVSGIGPISVAADWWSFGVLLFELLSGESLANRHPGGFFSHSVLDIPSNVPSDAADLVSKLVRHVPSERLGVGPNGVQSIKDHEFFNTIDWRNILLLSATV